MSKQKVPDSASEHARVTSLDDSASHSGSRKTRDPGGSLWTHSEGERPHTVVAYERKKGGTLYARAWDATARQWRKVSLGHRDKVRAKRYAREQVSKLESGVAIEQKVKLAAVFAEYAKHRTPKKSKAHQREDGRRSEMWIRVIGNIDPHTMRLAQWEAFIEARSTGVIDAYGRPVAEDERRPLRARGVEVDCVWLRAVFNWAVKWRLENGHYLMRFNPARGFETPREKNPRRPIVTQDRFEVVRAKSEEHTFEARWTGTRVRVRSYVSELLDIANGTGRRISAICSLRFEDLRLDKSKTRPYGAIHWPEDTDKEGYEFTAPLSPRARAAIDRIIQDRPGIGRAPLFPAPGDPNEPMSRHLADKWLREVERMAELEPQKGSLWHAYRRKWRTERKHLPDIDVAACGGWRSLQACNASYLQADEETMLAVVLGGGELRAAK